MPKLQETFGQFSTAELELIDKGTYVRLRVREPSGKASLFFLTDDDLTWLAEQALLIREARGSVRPTK